MAEYEKGPAKANFSTPETSSNLAHFPTIAREEGEGIFRFTARQFLAKKRVEAMVSESENSGMKKNLSVIDLLGIGIGCIIGTGIFVYSGIVAAKNAGPAVSLCFTIAGIVATLSALCYSEIAAMIPVAGSAYSYTYATMGEFPAWIVGWVLILEYMVGTAAVAVGWSGYLQKFIVDASGYEPYAKIIGAAVRWSEDAYEFQVTGNYFNLPAVIILIALTILLIVGTKESARVTTAMVILKIVIILVFIFACASDIDVNRLSPFIPSPVDDVYGRFGATGILKGSSIVFFCYTGFDSISTAAQEARNPGRDMPIGIIGSLIICTILYIVVCIVLVGIVDYHKLDVPQPITVGISETGKIWLSAVVGASAVFGMVTAMIVTMMAQSRIFYTMARDGLIPLFFGKVHPKFGTPYISTAIVGSVAALMAGTLPVDLLGELSGVGTLFGFFIVCLGVMILRIRRPDLPRPFKVPFGAFVIPGLGAITCIGLVASSSPATLTRLVIWIGIGLLVYLVYGRRNSRINFPEKWEGINLGPSLDEH